MATTIKEKKYAEPTTSLDKVGLCIVIVTVVIIFIVVVTGICVRFLLDQAVSRIILIVLICFLCVLGMVALLILELRRRKYAKNAVVTVRNGQYQNIQPTAPQDTSWEYSNNRATAQA